MQYINLANQHENARDSIWDEETREGKQFRNRFQVPYPMFHEILEEYVTVDPCKSVDRCGKDKSDIKLLVLGVFRVLAQHLPFDLIEELDDISRDKNNKFFNVFV